MRKILRYPIHEFYRVIEAWVIGAKNFGTKLCIDQDRQEGYAFYPSRREHGLGDEP